MANILSTKINQFLEGNKNLIFKSDQAKQQWLGEIDKTFEGLGEVIATKRTRLETTDRQFFDSLRTMAKNFVISTSSSRYVPSIIDSRTPEDKAAHSKQVEKLVADTMDKMSIVFRREHLGDTSIRSQIKQKIAGHMLYEGENDGKIQLRRNHWGLLSKPFSPDEVIMTLAGPFLDHGRTAIAQRNQDVNFRDQAFKNLGIYDPKSMNDFQKINLDEEVKRLKEENLTTYSTKKLPVPDESAYKRELKLRAFHQNGIDPDQALTLAEMRQLEGYQTKYLESLNSLDDLREITDQGPKVDSWSGFENAENRTGIFLSPEKMQLSDLAQTPTFESNII